MAGRIDCHIHYMPAAIGDQLQANLSGQGSLRRMIASRPAWRDLAVHQKLMQQSDVDVAVILEYGSELRKGLVSLGGDLNEATEVYNRSMSEDLRVANGRIVAAATVDPFGGKEAIAQLDRSLGLPNMVAVGLVSGYDGMALDDPVFHPIYDVARHHDVPILVHPSSVAQAWIETLRLDNLFLRSGFGFLIDDAMCIFRMVASGTFDRYPDVRFMFCQLGGVAPFCCGRWEYHRRQARSLQKELGEPLPSWAGRTLEDYLSHVWLDTHTQDRHALRLVLEEIGEHVVVLGGDHPYTPPDGGVVYAMAELDSLGVSVQTRQKVERDNALALLGPRVRALTG